LTHRHPAHFTYAFVMPVAQARDGLSREAPRFAPNVQRASGNFKQWRAACHRTYLRIGRSGDLGLIRLTDS